jgi:hypothetical protein
MKSRYLPFLSVLALFSACNGNSDKLFRQLPETHTGVGFSNDLTSNDELNAFNFTNFYNGGGVGVADFNQDGIPDICFTANQKDPEVYVGKGKMQFEKVRNPGLQNNGWATGVSICDINQDGWPDIYISMANHPSLKNTENQLYINQRTEIPSFKEEAAKYGLNYSGFTTQAVFFDYDKDGDLDAFLLNTDPDSGNPTHFRQAVNDGSSPSTDKLFENTGKQEDGTFRYEDISQKAGITYEGLGLGVALADFNNDGYIDIYCSNDFQSDDVLYLNNGDGTFKNIAKKSLKHTALFGMGIDAADFNNDGYTDILQLDMLPEDSERQKQMIARNDYEKKRLSVSPPFNYNLQYMRNMLQVNMGISDSIPYFSEQGLMYDVATTDWSWSVLLADFDLDGFKDIHISNGYRKNVTDLDFVSFHKNQAVFGDPESRRIAQSEIIKDVPEIKLKNYAFKNIPGKSFQDISEEWGLDGLSYSSGVAYADLDLDGDLDLVVNNIDEKAFIYENTAENKNYLKVELKGKEGNLEGIGATVKVYSGDTAQFYQNFPAKGYLSSMNTALVIGLGSSSIDSLEVIWPDQTAQKIYEVPKNQTLTLLQSDASDYASPEKPEEQFLFHKLDGILAYMHREGQYVDFHKAPTLQKMLSRNGPVIAKGDFNRDGLEDVVVGGAFNGSPTVVFLQKSDGKFVSSDTLDYGQTEVGDLVVFDADGDGKHDILLVSGYNENTPFESKAYHPKLFLNTEKGFTLSDGIPSLNVCSQSVLVADFNSDGQPDILIGGEYVPERYPEYDRNVLLINNRGKFSEKKEAWLENRFGIKNMIQADIDNDGDEDILLTGNWAGVLLLRNDGKSFNPVDLNLPKGWWNTIAATDIDNDGDLDLVLGNEGLNSLFKASEKEPVTIMGKDFNDDGRFDAIYGLYLKGKEVAVHPLGTLADQIIQFKRRYINFTDYSKSSLKDLFTSGDLKGAIKLKATELRTGIAINDGKGNFTFKVLPMEAQQAPVQSIIAADFTGDGNNDLLLVGNFFDNESSIGQSDASFGVLLKNNGSAEFKAIPGRKSGLFLPGNTRNALFLKDQNMLLVSQNNDKVVSFKVN